MTRRFRIAMLIFLNAALSPGLANAGGPYTGAASNAAERSKSRATKDMTERVCKVSYDATPSAPGGRGQLSSAQCPVSAALNKGDACFCVVDVEGQPYAAAGKVAFLLPGGGYSW